MKHFCPKCKKPMEWSHIGWDTTATGEIVEVGHWICVNPKCGE